MGKRKFRLAQRKNYERKKYQKCHESVIETCSVQSLNQSSSTNPSPSPESPERLSVSIPITSYSNGTVTSSKQLLMRLQSLKVTSNGWSLEGDSIGLGMFSVAKVFSYGTLKFTISSDCQWTAFINEHKISLPNHTLLQFSEEKVNTCDKVEKLLSNADKSCLCIGNPDEKFCEISDRKKGKFMNRCGKLRKY